MLAYMFTIIRIRNCMAQVVNVVTNKLVRVIGSGESGERFMFVALYQGVPKVSH